MSLRLAGRVQETLKLIARGAADHSHMSLEKVMIQVHWNTLHKGLGGLDRLVNALRSLMKPYEG